MLFINFQPKLNCFDALKSYDEANWLPGCIIPGVLTTKQRMFNCFVMVRVIMKMLAWTVSFSFLSTSQHLQLACQKIRHLSDRACVSIQVCFFKKDTHQNNEANKQTKNVCVRECHLHAGGTTSVSRPPPKKKHV